MFIIYLYNKFHIHSSSGSSVIYAKRQGKLKCSDGRHVVGSYTTKITFRKFVNFLQIYYHAYFQDHNRNGAGVASALHVRTSTMMIVQN